MLSPLHPRVTGLTGWQMGEKTNSGSGQMGKIILSNFLSKLGGWRGAENNRIIHNAVNRVFLKTAEALADD